MNVCVCVWIMVESDRGEESSYKAHYGQTSQWNKWIPWDVIVEPLPFMYLSFHPFVGLSDHLSIFNFNNVRAQRTKIFNDDENGILYVRCTCTSCQVYSYSCRRAGRHADASAHTSVRKEEEELQCLLYVVEKQEKKKMCDCVTSTKDSREIRCIQTVSEASIQFAFLVALVVHKVHMVTNFKTFEDMDRKNGHIIYTWVLWSHGSGKHELGCKVAMCRSVFVIAT